MGGFWWFVKQLFKERLGRRLFR